MIIRSSPKAPPDRTYIDNRVFENRKLFPEGFAMVGIILSFDDDWEFNLQDLEKYCKKEKPTFLKKCVQKLKDSGHLVENPASKGGWDFYELPKALENIPKVYNHRC